MHVPTHPLPDLPPFDTPPRASLATPSLTAAALARAGDALGAEVDRRERNLTDHARDLQSFVNTVLRLDGDFAAHLGEAPC